MWSGLGRRAPVPRLAARCCFRLALDPTVGTLLLGALGLMVASGLQGYTLLPQSYGLQNHLLVTF